MPDWVNSGYETYAKRLKPYYELSLTELSMIKRSANSNLKTIVDQECTTLLNERKQDHYLIALDEKGTEYTTKQFSQQFAKYQENYQGLQFIIGGPDGLNQAVSESADKTLSLSSFTLPHPLVRVILIEQLYRVTSLLHNHPYHRS